MRVAIVGGRWRSDRGAVEACIAALPPGTVIVSGGCRGPDQWAGEAAHARGLECFEHLPDLAGVRGRGEAARRCHDRDQAIVEDCDRLVSFVAPDRTGGAEDAIQRAVRAALKVELR
jgi:hypothetical protein